MCAFLLFPIVQKSCFLKLNQPIITIIGDHQPGLRIKRDLRGRKTPHRVIVKPFKLVRYLRSILRSRPRLIQHCFPEPAKMATRPTFNWRELNAEDLLDYWRIPELWHSRVEVSHVAILAGIMACVNETARKTQLLCPKSLPTDGRAAVCLSGGGELMDEDHGGLGLSETVSWGRVIERSGTDVLHARQVRCSGWFGVLSCRVTSPAGHPGISRCRPGVLSGGGTFGRRSSSRA